MTKQKTPPQKTDFILYDMDIQSKFAQMCQNFQKDSQTTVSSNQDWLIIDNGTGQIITQKPHT